MLPKDPLRSECRAAWLFDYCDFHSPSPAGGHNDKRFTGAGPLSTNCPSLCGSELLPEWTGEYLMLIVNAFVFISQELFLFVC